jgi:ureidoacrylate peracid hydrolase
MCLKYTSLDLKLGLIVVDMQNGFVAKGESYDKLGMNTPSYREIIPKVFL